MIKKLFKKFWNYGNDYTLGLGKELFLGLLIFLGIGFINFSSAGSYTYTGTVKFSGIYNSPNAGGYRSFSLPIPSPVLDYSVSSSIGSQLSDVNCDFILVDNPYGVSIDHVKLNVEVRSFTSNNSYSSGNDYLTNSHFHKYIGDWTALGGLKDFVFYFYYSYSSNSEGNVTMSFSCTFSGDNIINQSDLNYTCPECPSCSYSGYVEESLYNSCLNSLNSCQLNSSGYENTLNNCSLNLNSCNSSLNSCLLANCPASNSGDVQWSALYINDIQHNSAGIIDITIPEEIQWDYTNQNDLFDLDIEGYNVDSDYISGIITNQITLPNQVDLNNLVSGVLPLFVPGLVIILFIYFIFKFIKKIF